MQFLFQEEFLAPDLPGPEELELRFARFCDYYPAPPQAHVYALELLAGVMGHRQQIDTLLADSASNWRMERIALPDRNLLRIAVYEMLYSADAPDQVVINEAVEIAKRYGTEDSPAFINGILDAVRRVVRNIGEGEKKDSAPLLAHD